ncbi:hypothetical protein [Sulfurisphaera tokodaii]|uniref:Uncharacterized protein n=1 Tax=Sulfurisphaera tokodaii TaxID=111955 RepID=A0A832TI12_9CREN|nr:hypothetical protein [Sulfurisphaera tokodaii]HII73208.1 hypothetical protein [Sulfurisphaera tokodaii]
MANRDKMERNYISLADLFDHITIAKLRDPMSNEIKESMLMTIIETSASFSPTMRLLKHR